MARQLLGIVLLSIAVGCTALAQDAQPAQASPPAPDAQSVLQAMTQAMGGQDVKTLRYSGTGFTFAFGQNYSSEDPWPRFRLERYQRLLDYQNVASQEVLLSTQAESPPSGGGNQPIIGVREQIYGVSGAYAWNQGGTLAAVPAVGAALLPPPSGTSAAVPVPADADDRKIAIWLTPHGFVKAAQAHPVQIKTQMVRRQQVITVAFTLDNGVEVEGQLNSDNRVERVTTHVADPVLGDMLVDIAYLNYRDFDGLQFPAQILVQKGGYHTLEVTVTSVTANAQDFAIQVPTEARVGTVASTPVVAQPLAEGMWFLTGGPNNSVAVEFRDFVAIIEAPENEERALAVIAKVKELAPGKPIRYLINTHHHFDHVGGLRTFVAEGATIVTHASNRQFYGLMFSEDRNLKPDRLSKSNRHPVVQAIGEYYEIENGSRVLEIHHVRGNQHDAGLLMVYFPREKLLVEADVFTPLDAGAAAAAAANPNPYTVNLYENIVRLNLAVSKIAPIQGGIVPWSDLLKAVGKSGDEEPAPDLIRASMQKRRGSL